MHANDTASSLNPSSSNASSPNASPLDYRDAGVDIDRGNRLVAHIKTLTGRTGRPEVLAGVGGFGALFELPLRDYENPVLVSGTDGVGTKLKLAVQLGIHHTIGIDLVAMCANDILTHGATPLFFLDYFATGQLELTVAKQVMEGISRGCEEAGAALIGGETAEMPGVYRDGDYDLAGFCVGLVEKTRIIHGQNAAPGDVLIGLPATGPHSNGYSLIRKVLERTGQSLDDALPLPSSPRGRIPAQTNGQIPRQTPRQPHEQTLGEILLTPTRIYVRPILALVEQVPVKAIAHITGGGILENLPRVLPTGVHARIDTGTWTEPPVFHWLQTAGGIARQEMYRTFNCGIGMIVCVAAKDAPAAIKALEERQQPAWEIGVIEADASHSNAGNAQPEPVVFMGPGQ
uniref:Phosphoribosylformylglycinamidine cyclo-ligase n=1 Tax=Candidatus Kentrum sp. FM TaxID=2126340 RepID=A0A450W1S0_9GAMM|nr:MAG: phosphoribosylformylglycinamidine cyclo-ligase [Candidatus Kentron sp. FM]VFJ55842.1 MAG: phosphoribosylformylglycinamidine cyclo-ligase [Candidatus Kentron sp. FM]VFK11027.1 MAG: phosphoribosylformylglycinamidine cyclo-ligase [Candidatus Kentron sp. FM]